MFPCDLIRAPAQWNLVSSLPGIYFLIPCVVSKVNLTHSIISSINTSFIPLQLDLFILGHLALLGPKNSSPVSSINFS